jgi:hypothetical protein
MSLDKGVARHAEAPSWVTEKQRHERMVKESEFHKCLASLEAGKEEPKEPNACKSRGGDGGQSNLMCRLSSSASYAADNLMKGSREEESNNEKRS